MFLFPNELKKSVDVALGLWVRVGGADAHTRDPDNARENVTAAGHKGGVDLAALGIRDVLGERNFDFHAGKNSAKHECNVEDAVALDKIRRAEAGVLYQPENVELGVTKLVADSEILEFDDATPISDSTFWEDDEFCFVGFCYLNSFCERDPVT